MCLTRALQHTCGCYSRFVRQRCRDPECSTTDWQPTPRQASYPCDRHRHTVYSPDIDVAEPNTFDYYFAQQEREARDDQLREEEETAQREEEQEYAELLEELASHGEDLWLEQTFAYNFQQRENEAQNGELRAQDETIRGVDEDQEFKTLLNRFTNSSEGLWTEENLTDACTPMEDMLDMQLPDQEENAQNADEGAQNDWQWQPQQDNDALDVTNLPQYVDPQDTLWPTFDGPVEIWLDLNPPDQDHEEQTGSQPSDNEAGTQTNPDCSPDHNAPNDPEDVQDEILAPQDARGEANPDDFRRYLECEQARRRNDRQD